MLKNKMKKGLKLKLDNFDDGEGLINENKNEPLSEDKDNSLIIKKNNETDNSYKKIKSKLEIISENDVISELKEYMESDLKSGEDLSYKWIDKDLNIKFLNKCIEADISEIKSLIDRRDAHCELKVIFNF